ncbi:dTMP kinase [Planctomycetota bacterium]
MKGKLFVFEGPDGVGKSTLVDKTVAYFKSNRLPYKVFSFPGREEGTLGSHVYRIHHQWKSMGINCIHPASLQVLHIAAHIDSIENRIIPALKSGSHVILDRFWWSTWVYGIVSGVPQHSVNAMVKLECGHWDTFLPSAVFLIHNIKPLREDVKDSSWNELLNTYQKLAAEEKEHYPVFYIDTNRSINDTSEEITRTIQGMC